MMLPELHMEVSVGDAKKLEIKTNCGDAKTVMPFLHPHSI
jgi:hypothetical protein